MAKYHLCLGCGTLTLLEAVPAKSACPVCGAGGEVLSVEEAERYEENIAVLGRIIEYYDGHSPHHPSWWDAEYLTESGSSLHARLKPDGGVNNWGVRIELSDWASGHGPGILNASPELVTEELEEIARAIRAIGKWKPGSKVPAGWVIHPEGVHYDLMGVVVEWLE